MLGPEHEIVSSRRARTAQAPGGTGALRVAAEFLAKHAGIRRIWVSAPTWANHAGVFGAAGLDVATYPYYDAAAKRLDLAGMRAALSGVDAGDAVLFHACCHNPTGLDPTAGQWAELAQVRDAVGFLPLFDFAYQGFGDGLEEDAAGLRQFASPGRELLIASSFSKNLGLYNERVGALTLVAGSPDVAARSFSQVMSTIRVNYSNPPAHGAAVAAVVLGDPELRVQWQAEVAAMRGRIKGMRSLFVDTLKAKGVTQDFGFIAEQRGMFSFSGLDREQVDALRRDHSIYIVGSGRINVAGMTTGNMDRLCAAIAQVLA